MPRDHFTNDIENRSPQKRYAEDIYHSLPETEIGTDIQRVQPTLLSSGKDTKVRLSVEDRLGRDGWDPKQVFGARTGSILQHRNGDIFEVVKVNNRDKRLDIKNRDETDMEGAIIAAPRVLNAHEYGYKISDNAGHSKRIKVLDTVIKKRDLRTSEFINTLIKAIPTQCMQVFDEIQIHTQNRQSGSFRVEPSLTSEKAVINLYVSEDLQFFEGEEYPTKEAVETLYHELGHAVVKFLKGSVHPGKKWRQTMDASGNDVSEYAAKTRYPKKHKSDEDDHGEIEDVADSFRLYFATDGAKSPQAQALREFCKPRFEKLDEVMDDLERRQNSNFLRKRVFKPVNSLEK